MWNAQISKQTSKQANKQNKAWAGSRLLKMFLALLLLLTILVLPVLAAEEETKGDGAEQGEEEAETEIVYDVFIHKETAGNVYMAIGGVSIATGIGIVVNGNTLSRGIGYQNIIWGIVETGFSLYNKNWAEREVDEETAKKKLEKESQEHLWIDLALVAIGSAFTIFGNEDIRGHGFGMMIQGTILALYDTVNLVIVRNPERVKDWKVDSGWNVYCLFNIRN